MSEMTGLRFELDAQGYQALPIAHGQAHLCWEAPYQNTLLELAGEIFPRAVYAPEKEPSTVCFSYTDEGGEWMHASHASNEEEPTLEEFRRVQDCFEYLYSLTVDPRMPRSKRDFLRNLRLPDPRLTPELWRVVNGRLFILWGLAKRGMDGTFSPYLASPEGGLCGLLGISPESAQKPEQAVSIALPQPQVQAISSQVQEPESLLPWWKKVLHFLLGAILCLLGLILLLWVLRSCTAEEHAVRRSFPPRARGPEMSSPTIPGGHAKGDIGSSGSEEEEDSRSIPEPGPLDGENASGGLSSPPPAAQLRQTFRVELLCEQPDPGGQLSQVSFQMVPEVALPEGVEAQVRAWSINGRVVPDSESWSFTPENGLRYDRNYTISATVLIDGVVQWVVPYQWNLADEPTWQIVEEGVERDGCKVRYRLVCCNASTVTPKVRAWQVSFREASSAATELSFACDQSPLEGNRLAVSWDIGTYKGAYFLELAADLQYTTLRGHTATLTHRELIPFVHASSAEELSRAKYEAVIDNVYFCLATLTDGTLSNGTAFAISNRRLLTNYHVAVGSMPGSYASQTDYTVRPVLELSNGSGLTYHARVVASDRGRDLALLELCDAQGGETDARLPGYLPLATSEALAGISPETPRHVFAVGYPRGTVRMGPPALAEGKTERIERVREVETLFSFIGIKPGYSGGPLVDCATGTILGINHSAFVEKSPVHKGADLATAATEVRCLPRVH
ncbi:MAG: serine protease [Candidatus Spyradenecus sp.]